MLGLLQSGCLGTVKIGMVSPENPNKEEVMSSDGMHPHPESLYYHIALDTLTAAKSETDEFRTKQLVCTSLVFSALCLEAFINQQFAEHSGTANILEDDDHLPLETKWLMLPLLLGASETFNKGKQPYQTFRELISLRNHRLVHFKPAKETRISGENYKKEYFGEVIGSLNMADKYVVCVAEMIRELSRLTNGKTVIPKFLDGEKYLSTIRTSATINYEIT